MKILTYFDFRILTIGLIISTGCDCCCECRDEGISYLTININGFLPYSGRTCAIPISGGELTGTGGNIIPFIVNSSPEIDFNDFLDSEKYYLWVEFETCCDNFATSTEFEEFRSDGLGYYYHNTNTGTYRFILVFNTKEGGSSITFPFPSNSNSPNPLIRLRYYEPCFQASSSCESPFPCSESVSARANFETDINIPWVSSNPYADWSITTLLVHSSTICSDPLPPYNSGWYCN